MTDHSFEQRLAAAIAAYADHAPTDVDAQGVARLVAASRGLPWPIRPRVMGPSRALGFALLLLALLVAIVGGSIAVGGRLFLREPEDVLTKRAFVEPFVGLPPEGTVPSTPEAGELVLQYWGRVPGHGLGFTFVYADGRLISGVEAARVGYDVVEQDLTSEGVELMRSAALSDTLLDPDRDDSYGEPNPLSRGGGPGDTWGGLQVRVGEQRFQVSWSDPALPARIRDPESWLPEHAWSDRRAMPYVASRYAVCVEVPGVWGEARDPRSAVQVFELLPRPIQRHIRSMAIEGTPRRDDPRCLYEVTTANARVIVATLEGATLERTMAETYAVLRWTTGARPYERGAVMVELLRVLPDGSSVCNCG